METYVTKNSFYCRPVWGTMVFVVIGIILTALACSTMQIRNYVAPELSNYKINKIVLMPMVITAGSLTQVSTSYSPDWITVTTSTAALSPAEYYPAEQEFVTAISENLSKVQFIRPGVVDTEMKKSPSIPTYQEAIISVAKRFDGDAVLAFRLRDVNLISGSQIEGPAAAKGHADLTLYSPTGDALWSVSTEASLRKGAAWSPAPPLDLFVKYIMRGFGPDLQKLSQIIS